VTIAAKALGVPHDVDNFIDPALWDQSNLYLLFFQWFEAFACGHWELPIVRDPGDLYDEFLKIDEFSKLIDGKLLRKGYKGVGYFGDREFHDDEEFEEYMKRRAEAAA
jgi:hypothetical protein